MVQPIYRWNGEYFGFISNKRLFDKDCNYLGWIDDNEVWRKDGTYLGELVDGAYVLRRTSMGTRETRGVRATPPIPATPTWPASRPACPRRVGYVDALDEFR